MLGLTQSTKQPLRIHILFWTWVTCAFLVLVFMLDSSVSKKLHTSFWQRKDMHSCEMTYIYPNYHPVQPQPNSSFSKKYTMYLYREGHFDSEHLVGVPVLFIPGQAGSYKQVRSIASETSKYSFLKKSSVSAQDIDWFTLDLNEELTAFSGQHILDQATFTNAAIQTILGLYNQRVNSVILVGHSMGGIVARTVLMQPDYAPHSVQTLITLATPHQSAPILLDPVLDRVYRELSAYWLPSQFETGSLQEVTLISVAGGSLDTIVRSDNTGLHGIVPDSHGFAIYTTSVPFVWTGSDHMAILWCNQLVKLLARTLVDLSRPSKPVYERMNIFKQHLLDNQPVSFKKEAPRVIPESVQILDLSSKNGHRLTKAVQPRLTLVQNSSQFHFLTDLTDEYDHLWQLVTCEKKTQWACQTLEPTITLLPSASAENLVGSTPYRSIGVSLDQPTRYLGLLEKNTAEPIDPFIIIYSHSISLHTFTTWDVIWKKTLNVNGYHSRHVFPYLRNSLFAYDLYVVKSSPKPLAHFEPMMRQTMHNKEAKYYRGLKESESDLITFHQAPGNEGLAFEFFIDDQEMELVLSIDWYTTLGRCALGYGSVLFQYWYIFSLLILSSMSFTFVVNGEGEFISYKGAMISCANTSFVQISFLLVVGNICQYFIQSHPVIPESLFLYKIITRDMFFGSDEPMLILISLFLLMVAFGLTAIVWLTVTLVISILSVPLRFFYPFSVALSPFSQFNLHVSFILVSLRFIPISVLFILYYVAWLFMTAYCRYSATRSDLPRFRNMYRYRQSWLLFLTSLLPYHVPNVIVYVKDLLVGWTEHEIFIESLTEQLPSVFVLIYLVTFGKDAKNIHPRALTSMIYIGNMIAVYQLVFGFAHPFTLSTLLAAFF